MKATLIDAYGKLEDLHPGEIPTPTVTPGSLLVRVKGASVNPADMKTVRGEVKILHDRRFPMVIGWDFSGPVEAVGPNVTAFKVGDEVYGFLPYGMGNGQGTYGEFVCVPGDSVAIKPKRASHVEAASAATSALTALQILRPALAGKTGASVLVHGASGGVGSYAVQIARLLGARVTGTCSAANLDYVRSLGANEVVDYRATPLANLRGSYDVVFDVVSNTSYAATRHLLKPGGAYRTLLPSLGFATGFLASLFSSHTVRMIAVKSIGAELAEVAAWIDAGKLQTPVAETFALADLVAALKRAEGGSVRGKIGVSVG